MSQNIYAIGASKNIGYHASLRLLAAGCNVLFLLRNTSVFDNDAEMKPYIESGKARLLQGDALKKEDIQHGWDEAANVGPVDVVLISIGGKPTFNVRHGMVLTPPNIVTQCILNVLSTYPTHQDSQPKLILHSSIAVTKTGYSALPALLKPLYGYLIHNPHQDKIAAERILFHCAGRPWDTKEAAEPTEAYLPAGWKETEGLIEEGGLKRYLIIRPALLNDGKCLGDEAGAKGKGKSQKPPYRVSEAELGGYMISRKDVAHFDVDVILNKWDQYEGKIVNVGY